VGANQKVGSAIAPVPLSDAEWGLLEPLLPVKRPPRRRPTYTRRAILDAIVFTLRTGCTWRAIPRDLPHWNTVYWYFKEWRKDGTWARMEVALRAAGVFAEGDGDRRSKHEGQDTSSSDDAGTTVYNRRRGRRPGVPVPNARRRSA
jgi:putative transposase